VDVLRRGRSGPDALDEELVALILRLARENPRSGYLRIVVECRKLGATVSATTVRKVLKFKSRIAEQDRRRSSILIEAQHPSMHVWPRPAVTTVPPRQDLLVHELYKVDELFGKLLEAARDDVGLPHLELTEGDKPAIAYIGPLGTARPRQIKVATDEHVESAEERTVASSSASSAATSTTCSGSPRMPG
jgi:hypothetical protein